MAATHVSLCFVPCTVPSAGSVTRNAVPSFSSGVRLREPSARADTLRNGNGFLGADRAKVAFSAARTARPTYVVEVRATLSPSEVKGVFVAGATGETGRRIVQELLNRGVAVRAGVRNPEEAPGVVPQGALVVKADVKDKKELEGAIGDAEVIVCASGVNYRKGETKNPLGPFSVDFVGTKNLVDVAKAKNVKHFVLVTSLCVSKFFHPLNLFFLILFWKKRAEDYLIGSGVTYTIVRPGGLTNDELPDAVLAGKADTLFKGRIPRSKVAKVTVDAVFEPSSYNKIVEIVTDPAASSTSAADLFSTV